MNVKGKITLLHLLLLLMLSWTLVEASDHQLSEVMQYYEFTNKFSFPYLK